MDFETLCQAKDSQYKLMDHQIKTADYIANESKRGLLIYHEIGSGKTLTSLECLKRILETREFNKVYLVVSKIIFKNYGIEIEKFGYGFLNKYIIHVDYETLFTEEFTSELEGSIVLIDEVHNYNNAIFNRNFHATSLFEKIKSTNKIKIIIMSGSPIYNTPFDASLLRNILTKEDVFTRSGVEFEKRYTNPFTHQLYRVGEFRNYFQGYISYFKGFAGTPLLPQNLGLKLIDVSLTPEQTTLVYRSKSPDKDLIAINPYTSNLSAKFVKALELINGIGKEPGSVFVYCNYDDIASGFKHYLETHSKYKSMVITPQKYKSQIEHIGEVKVIIGTLDGSVGITLPNCRYCIILDIPEYYGLLEQIQGRVVRLCSHEGLKKQFRNVQFYMIMANFPDGNKTTDYMKFDQIKSYNNIILNTLQYLKEATI